jgi:ribosomal protein L23
MLNTTYTIEVDSSSTKIDIKKAFSEIYWAEVSDVKIINTREKFKNWKKWPQVKRRSIKKAYVTLKDSKSKVDFSIIK